MSEKSRAGGGAKPAAPRRPRTPSALLKFVMAVSGVVLLGYVTLHMIGNLKIFFGPEAIDHYAAWLRTILEPALPYSGMLWIVRVVLFVAVVAHIWSATMLALRARRARPIKYAGGSYQVKGSYAARTMRWGGVIIALFVVYHLLDLTAGTLNPNGVHLAVADNLAADFTLARWYVTLFYVLAVVALGFHVQHGIFSGIQTLGWSSNSRERTIKVVSTVFAAVLTLGFISVPLAVTFGVV
ncbi:succinate dehydrogenase cytochrome b subunit [Pseudonocardia tropica]|uniref:Succinate dehydrogenase cytochrome b subunit n=1 Tax=Pseudonocardia tropica TaxID=681289 RepID=A0ABV1K1B1_9PSEU